MPYVIPQAKKNIAYTCGGNMSVYADRVKRASS
jgi:hypothetical protein